MYPPRFPGADAVCDTYAGFAVAGAASFAGISLFVIGVESAPAITAGTIAIGRYIYIHGPEFGSGVVEGYNAYPSGAAPGGTPQRRLGQIVGGIVRGLLQSR